VAMVAQESRLTVLTGVVELVVLSGFDVVPGADWLVLTALALTIWRCADYQLSLWPPCPCLLLSIVSLLASASALKTMQQLLTTLEKRVGGAASF